MMLAVNIIETFLKLSGCTTMSKSTLIKNIKSYNRGPVLNHGQKDKSKWNGKPKLPNYKKKNSLRYLTFTNQAAVIKKW